MTYVLSMTRFNGLKLNRLCQISTINTIIVCTNNTMKNITLSAPEALINQARERVVAKGTTLNQEFRD